MNYIEMSSNSVYYFIRFPETEVPVIDIRKRQTMRQSLKSTPPIIGDVASCIRPEDYLTMA